MVPKVLLLKRKRQRGRWEGYWNLGVIRRPCSSLPANPDIELEGHPRGAKRRLNCLSRLLEKLSRLSNGRRDLHGHRHDDLRRDDRHGLRRDHHRRRRRGIRHRRRLRAVPSGALR